jgi:hypothetical protein
MADLEQNCSTGDWIFFQKNRLSVPGYKRPSGGKGFIFVKDAPFFKFNFLISALSTAP